MSAPSGPTYLLVVLSTFYLLPLILMVYCMIRLLISLRHADSRVQPPTIHPPSHLGFYSQIRTAYTVVIMLIVFILTRGVASIVALCVAVAGGTVSHTLDNVLMILLWSNAAVNPLIYIARNGELRRLLALSRPVRAEQHLNSFTNISRVPATLDLSRSLDFCGVSLKPMQITAIDQEFSTL